MAEPTVEETKDTSTQQDTPQTSGQTTEQPSGVQQEEEVDLDRAKSDPDYLDQVNERLRQQQPAPQEAATEAAKEEAAPEGEAKAAGAEDDPVVETIIYKGQKLDIRKSQQKDLLQKGRHLETRLQELAPVLRTLQQHPDLAEAIRSGNLEQWKTAHAAAKAKDAGKADDDLPEVPGYDKDDLATVARIVDARLEKRLTAQQQREQEATRAQRMEVSAETQRYMDTLRAVDDNFDANLPIMRGVVSKMQRDLPPEQFKQFWALHDDPRKINPATGKSFFHGFYKAIDAERRRQEGGAAVRPVSSGAPPVNPSTRVAAPGTSARIAPGASSTTTRSKAGDPWAMKSEDFDRVMNEVLQR